MTPPARGSTQTALPFCYIARCAVQSPAVAGSVLPLNARILRCVNGIQALTAFREHGPLSVNCDLPEVGKHALLSWRHSGISGLLHF